jgi:hypothetical protein
VAPQPLPQPTPRQVHSLPARPLGVGTRGSRPALKGGCTGFQSALCPTCPLGWAHVGLWVHATWQTHAAPRPAPPGGFLLLPGMPLGAGTGVSQACFGADGSLASRGPEVPAQMIASSTSERAEFPVPWWHMCCNTYNHGYSMQKRCAREHAQAGSLCPAGMLPVPELAKRGSVKAWQLHHQWEGQGGLGHQEKGR